MAEDRLPVLLDTDIGSDIDDAVALTYLLSQPRCELVGITTVTGEPAVRAQLADAICQAFGRKDVPIHSGAGKPLLVPQKQPDVPQRTVLSRYPHRETFAANTAVDFLRQAIRSRPGDITLLTIGPLTNVGLLFALDPEIPALLKQHVMMAGVYADRPPGCGLTEWNVTCDPHASAIVFGARPPVVRCVGLEVTTRCEMPAEEFRRRFSERPRRIVGEMAEEWFKHRPVVTFHDPLATADIFQPGILSYRAGLVQVELESDKLRGLTHFDPDAPERPHQVAVGVEPDAFFEHYFEIVR
ncbi:MAG TPA: nucleoside hydrolase [Phycisphaerae bacterium]|nr:nucleoside hydrolase [Phycisphaerae bacterium]HRR84650.1 nucleoside hydrolase [Phycisphaerae bacterium]